MNAEILQLIAERDELVRALKIARIKCEDLGASDDWLVLMDNVIRTANGYASTTVNKESLC